MFLKTTAKRSALSGSIPEKAAMNSRNLSHWSWFMRLR